MMSTQPNERSAAEWATMLDEIQASIAATLDRTPEPMPGVPPGDPDVWGSNELEALDHRLKDMQASLERAERCAAETDAALQSEAEAIFRWRQALKQVHEKLANVAA